MGFGQCRSTGTSFDYPRRNAWQGLNRKIRGALANALEKLRDDKRVLELLKQNTAIAKTFHGANSLEYKAELHGLGKWYIQLENYDLAIEHLEASKRIKLSGSEEEKNWNSYIWTSTEKQIGHAFYGKRDLKQALAAYQNYVAVFEADSKNCLLYTSDAADE